MDAKNLGHPLETTELYVWIRQSSTSGFPFWLHTRGQLPRADSLRHDWICYAPGGHVGRDDQRSCCRNILVPSSSVMLCSPPVVRKKANSK